MTGTDLRATRERARILILTAPVGGGHDAAARAVAADLEELGCEVVVHNALRRVGAWAEWLVVAGYTAQLQHAPWMYDALYRAIVRFRLFARFLKWLTGLLGSRQIAKLVDSERPDAVLTTYHLASAMLVRRRRKGKLPIPIAALVTDLAPHPMWIYPELDAHIVLHPRAARVIEPQVRGRVLVARPPVQPKFRTPTHRTGSSEGCVALIVGGDWGVGQLEHAAKATTDAGWKPVIVCGHNEHLKARLDASAPPSWKVLGFVDNMPALLDHSDVVVLSGPGATCLEAFARRTPVVFFEPFAGHGIDNARYLEECGLARFPRSAAEFVEELHARRGHSTPLEVVRAARLFDPPACANLLLDLARPPVPRRRRARTAVALVGGLAALLSLTGSGVSAEMRALRRPAVRPGGNRPEVALCVRVGPDLRNAAPVLADLAAAGAHATFFVSGRAAARDPRLVRDLASGGNEIGNAGDGRGIGPMLFPHLARRNARHGAEDIFEATGTSPRYYLPSGRLSLSEALGASGEKPVLRAHRQRLGRQNGLHRGEVIVVDLGRPDGRRALATLLDAARRQGLRVTDLSQMLSSQQRRQAQDRPNGSRGESAPPAVIRPE